MEARLFLHIGPPKTASTALQCALQSARLERLVYGGVYQPRSKNTDSLAQRLQLLTDGRRRHDDLSVVSAINEIRESIASGDSVIVSEEMFLVAERNCGFTEKLQKLRNAFRDIPTTVIFTVRNPIDAIPSLYQELFPSLRLAEQLSFRQFCLSETAKCFDYQRILDDLAAVGFNDYRAIDFASLTSGEMPVSALIGRQASEGLMLPLKAMNVGKKFESGRALPRVSLRRVVELPLLKTRLKAIRIGDYSLADTAAAILDRVTLRREGNRKLSLCSDMAERLEVGYKKALALCVQADDELRN